MPEGAGDPEARRLPQRVRERWGVRAEGSARARRLLMREYAFFVVDESHRARNDATRLFAACMHAGLRAYSCLCLSGTPFNNFTKDVANQMSIARARPDYCEADNFVGKVQVSFLTRMHLESLVKHTKAMLRLPALREHDLPLEMEEDERLAALEAAQRCLQLLLEFKTKMTNHNFSAVLAQLTVMRKVAVSRFMVTDPEGGQDCGAERARVARLIAEQPPLKLRQVGA